VDPRKEGGKMNSCATDELVELIKLNGEEYLFYKGFRVDVAILRGTIADENGNISFAHESVIHEGLAVATAAKNSGGIVIVQVEYITKSGTLNPKDVKIPGVLVDYVVQATDKDACWQAEEVYYEPAFSGQIKKPLNQLEAMPFDEKKVICRRCAMELKKGNIINLGVGMAADVPKIIAEEGLLNQVTMTTVSGMIGGIPSVMPNLGSSYNPEATVEHGAMFDMIDGGGLDVTCLGLGEIDKYGNNNISKFGTRLTGPGEFINVTHATSKVIFCGNFVGKARVRVGEGKITILDEGSIRKFVDTVEQITFSGQYAKDGQEVLYITERCVFRLIDKKMTLIEIAPGINLKKDILDQMDFKPEISKNLQIMPPEIFCEVWGGLNQYM
jgi:propionate CoA-transferase